jgi:uncharacterized protein YigE (DUF2233 family)
LLALAACGDATDRVPRAPATPATREPEPPPPTPPPSVTSIAEDVPLPRGKTYRLVRIPIDVARARFTPVDLVWDRTVAAELEGSRASVVINGGFWNPDREPEGLTVVDGRVVVAFEPELAGGILVVEGGRARVLDGELGHPIIEPSWSFAQQAKPRLVVDGAVQIERDTGRRADRTAVCIRDEGRTIELLHARTADDRRGRDGPTLYTFAEKLVALGCDDALNLDGGPSSGLAWREDGAIRDLPTRVGVRLAIAVTLEGP